MPVADCLKVEISHRTNKEGKYIEGNTINCRYSYIINMYKVDVAIVFFVFFEIT